MDHNENTEKNVLEQAEELAGMEFSATIEDNAFVIRPADAGIALLASITTHNTELEEAWKSADYLATRLESLRDENGRFREELETVAEILDLEGYRAETARINNMLWAVVGVTDDGTEVPFEYSEDLDED